MDAAAPIYNWAVCPVCRLVVAILLRLTCDVNSLYHEFNMRMLAYGALGQGPLPDKYAHGSSLLEEDPPGQSQESRGERFRKNLLVEERLTAAGRRYCKPAAEVTIWVLDSPPVTCVTVDIGTTQQALGHDSYQAVILGTSY